jgi:hypothetical protein
MILRLSSGSPSHALVLFFLLLTLLGCILFSGLGTEDTYFHDALGQEKEIGISGQAALPPIPAVHAVQAGQSETPLVGKTVRPSSIVLMNIEWLETKEKAGDAETNPDALKIFSEFADEECCYVVQYTPKAAGKAGLAYKAVPGYDLTDSKRVVFFAKGQQGGEKVSFAVAGKEVGQGDGRPFALTDTFKKQKFQLITKDVTLGTDWKRYEINVDGVDLKGIVNPFGFIIKKGQGPESVAFSLRDITYDSDQALNPLEIEAAAPINLTSSSSINVQPNSTALNGNGSFALGSAEELEANTTNDSAFLDQNSTSVSVNDSGTYNQSQPILIPQSELVTNRSSSPSFMVPSPSLTPSITAPTAAKSSPSNNTAVSGGNSTDIINPYANQRSIFGTNVTTYQGLQSEVLRPFAADTMQYSLPMYNNQVFPFSLYPPLASTNITELKSRPNVTWDIGSETTEASDVGSSQTGSSPQQQLLPSPTLTTQLPSPPQQQLLPSPTLTTQLPSANFDITPPETVITSATEDRTLSDIQNGVTIESPNSLTFVFEGSDDVGVGGYLCSIDDLPLYNCTSPTSFANYPHPASFDGNIPHTFKVSAVDITGNVDPVPATFNWISSDSIEPQPPMSQIAPQTLNPGMQTTFPFVDSNN